MQKVTEGSTKEKIDKSKDTFAAAQLKLNKKISRTDKMVQLDKIKIGD